MRYLLLVLLFLKVSMPGIASQNWNIILHPSLQNDEAIKVVLDDMNKTGDGCDIHFTIVNTNHIPKGNTILVDVPGGSELIRKLTEKLHTGKFPAQKGFRIATEIRKDGQIMLVSGGDVLGAVYGLYWIWDRMRVFRTIPEINIIKEQKLKERVSLSWGRTGADGNTKEEIRNALRNGINWISGPAVLDLIPWDSEPERSNNAKTREKTRELIAYAHALHLNFYSFAAEFTYHPSLLKKFGATLSPADPRMWDAIQEKYRMLFKAMPELDGVEICNDDISGFWDNYRPYDIMFDENDTEWSYEKRFKTFIEKVHEVVSGEYNKVLLHFTWSLVPYKQHNQPAIFKQIFTKDLPAKNILLLPKITQADRWWFQPYNNTFNLTPHPTAMSFETINYYESSKVNIFPTCAGAYYQAGLQYVLSDDSTNLCGTGFRSAPEKFNPGTYSITPYMLNRLSWDPNEEIHSIVSDFCAINYGAEAASKMADIYLMSAQAYKYGLHIEPVSYGQFNSFLHMRVGEFVVKGYSRLDRGKEHLKFLKEIYLKCKPWLNETYLYLDHGLETSGDMCKKFNDIKSQITDQKLATTIENQLLMTQRLIRTNNFYVRTFFSYFRYLENDNQDSKFELDKSYRNLLKAVDEFKATPGFGYQLYGVDVILKSAGNILNDRETEIKIMKNQPESEEIEHTIHNQQALYKEVLKKYAGEAVKFFEFEGGIDGRDILHIKGDNVRIEHLSYDPPFITKKEFFCSLPNKNFTIIPKDIESKPIHQFILEQPSKENDYTVQVYLYDVPPGTSVNHFELYYIPRSPIELGLEIPWNK
jgi:hypothetical protein